MSIPISIGEDFEVRRYQEDGLTYDVWVSREDGRKLFYEDEAIELAEEAALLWGEDIRAVRLKWR